MYAAMFNVEMNEQQEPLGINESDLNLKIDFCVWVLEVDGLRIPPFDKHQGGNKLLQAEGFNADTWREWLSRVVATQDLRLSVLQKPEEWIEMMIKSRNITASYEELDIDKLRASLAQEVSLMSQQNPKLIELAQSFSWTSIPPEIWTGESNIGDILQKLWEDYLRAPRRGASRSHVNFEFYDELQKYRDHLSYLHIYPVDYPTPVEYIVPPAAIILSLANGTAGSSVYCQSVLRAARQLADINGSS